MAITEKHAIVACDCVNGMTYLGIHLRATLERAVAELELKDYIVVPTSHLAGRNNTADYKSDAKAFYNNPSKFMDLPIKLRRDHRVAFHIIDEVDVPVKDLQ